MATATTNTSSSTTKSKSIGKAAEVSPAVHKSAADRVTTEGGKRMFKMADGKSVELPADMTAEEAAKLEADGNAAKKQLGKGPAPKPVPDVKEKAKGKEKKAEKKAPPAKKKKPEIKGGKGKVHNAEGKGGKGAIKGKVGAWLLAKGAPSIARGQSKLAVLKTNEQKHDDAASKLSQTQKAVVPPALEGQSKSNTGQVKTVEAKPEPPVNEVQAKQALDQAIEANIPQNIEDVDNFKRDNKAGHMSAAAGLVVNTDKNAVSGTFGDMKQTPAPTPSDVKPEALPPEEIAPVTAKMNLGTDTIAPLQKEHTDVSNYTKEADSKLQEEGVTQEQLDMVDSGDLAEANKEKKGMQKKASTEPLAVQQFAQQQNKEVDKDLQQEETKGKDEIKNQRKKQLGATKDKQNATKTGIEKKREEVTAKINQIYTDAQTKVTKKLADLETVAIKRFDAGNEQATKEFEGNVKSELDAFKDERYSGFWGWAKKAKDWLLGMDDLPQVKAIFDRNRAIFVKKVNTLVETISADNKKVVQECKDELANARKTIEEYVSKLGPELQDVGKKAQEEMNGKLDELDQFVAKKEKELQDKLADKQKAAIKAIDEKIEKMKEEMSGALSKLGKLLLLAAKKFFTWALEKFGFSLAEIEGIINKGAAVLKAIFTQPIQFVKNLMNAALTGFKNFGKNFLKHLQNALFEWLTGSLEGLVLPKTWDFKGIVGIALQMIGISYQNIRRHMVTEMGEPVVAGLEKTFTLVVTLVTEGPMAAWEQLKEMAGEMKEAFIDAVKDFIKTKIIEQAIQWLVSLFVPGAGIIKAIVGIYDTVVFFIQKAKQIMQMVGNFLGSIAEIASGNIGAAADAMENGLARGLSLVINFLAALLRLNGITDKIKNAIQKIRDKVDGVLSKVAKWIKEKAMKVIGGVKNAVGSVISWWKGEKKFNTKDGKQHRIYFEGEGAQAKLIVRSDPKPFSQMVNDRKAELDSKKDEDKPKITALGTAETEKTKLDGLISSFQSRNINTTTPAQSEALNRDIQTSLNTIGSLLSIAGVDNTPTDLVKTNVVHTLDAGRASYVKAEPLTYLPGNTSGSQPGEDPLGWSELESLPMGRSSWVRAHLLNGNLHGPGEKWNLTPGTVQTNNNMRTEVEHWAKLEVLDPGHKNNIYYYETNVTYYPAESSFDAMKYFPKTIRVKWGDLQKEGAGYKRLNNKGKTFEQDKPPAKRLLKVSFNQGTSSDLFRAADGQLTIDECLKIIDLRRTLPEQKFNSILTLSIKYRTMYPGLRNLTNTFNTLYLDNKIGLNSI